MKMDSSIQKKIDSPSNSTLKHLLQSTEKFSTQTWEDQVIRNLHEDNNEGNTGEIPSNPVTPKVPDTPSRQQDGPKQMTPGELQEEQTRERVGRQILTSVEQRIESAKKELSALWDLAFDLPFGEDVVEVVSDRVAHKAGHEFRSSVKQIDVTIKSASALNTQKSYKDLNSRSLEAMSYRPRGLYEDKIVADIESDNRDRKKKEIRIRINSIMAQFLAEIIKIVRGEKIDPKSILFQSEKDAQIDVLKGHVIRRNKLLTEQRSDYLKELIILREQVYRKQSGEDDNPEDWGHHFDYEGEELNKTLGRDKKQDGSQKNAVTNLKREFAAEKRKMKSQFEYEVKKMETHLKQQLKAREKELSELKSSLAKAKEEEKEKILTIEVENKKEMDRAQIVFDEKLKGMQDKHYILMGMIEDQKKDRRSALGEKDELWNERLQSLLKIHQAELDKKEAEVKSKQLLVEDLKAKMAKLNSVVLRRNNPELESALAFALDEKEKTENMRQNMQHREQLQELQTKHRTTEITLERCRMRNEELLGKLYALEVRLKAREDVIKQQASASQIKDELGRKLGAVRREVQKQRDSGREKDNQVLLDRVRETERLLDTKIAEMETQSEEYLDLLKTLSETEQELDKLHQSYLRKKGMWNELPDSPSSASSRLEKARQALSQQVQSHQRAAQLSPQPASVPQTHVPPSSSPRSPPLQPQTAPRLPPATPQTPKAPGSSTASNKLPPSPQGPVPSTNSTPRVVASPKISNAPTPLHSAELKNMTGSVSATASVSSMTTNLSSMDTGSLVTSISEDRNQEIKKEILLIEQNSVHSSPRLPLSAHSSRSPSIPNPEPAESSQSPGSEPIQESHNQEHPVEAVTEEPQQSKVDKNDSVEEQPLQEEKVTDQAAETADGVPIQVTLSEQEPELQPEQSSPQEQPENQYQEPEATSLVKEPQQSVSDEVLAEDLYEDPELQDWDIPALAVPTFSDPEELLSPVSVISLSVPEDTPEPDYQLTEPQSLGGLQQRLDEAIQEVNKLRKENEYLRQLLFGRPVTTPAFVVPPLDIPTSAESTPVLPQAPPSEPAYHFTLAPSELIKKFAREKDPYNIENYNNTQVSQMSVWERLQFRARLLQQKLRFTIESLEKQRRSRIERVLGENELLDPKYNVQITSLYIPKGPLPTSAPIKVSTPAAKTAEAHKWMMKEKPQVQQPLPSPSRPSVQLQYTGTIPSVTSIREVPLYVTTMNKAPISLEYYAEPAENTFTVVLPPAQATGYADPYSGPPPGSLVVVKRPQSASRRKSPSPPKSRPSSANPSPVAPSPCAMGPSSRLTASLLPLHIKKRLRFTLPEGTPEKPVRAAHSVHVPASVKAVLEPN